MYWYVRQRSWRCINHLSGRICRATAVGAVGAGAVGAEAAEAAEPGRFLAWGFSGETWWKLMETDGKSMEITQLAMEGTWEIDGNR